MFCFKIYLCLLLNLDELDYLALLSGQRRSSEHFLLTPLLGICS